MSTSAKRHVPIASPDHVLGLVAEAPSWGRTPSVFSHNSIPRQVNPAHCSAPVVSGCSRQSVNCNRGASSFGARLHSARSGHRMKRLGSTREVGSG